MRGSTIDIMVRIGFLLLLPVVYDHVASYDPKMCGFVYHKITELIYASLIGYTVEHYSQVKVSCVDR